MSRSVVGTVSASSTTCEWKIQNYTSYSCLTSGKDRFIRSPPFCIHQKSWHLRMFPNGTKDNASENYVSLFLHANNTNDELIRVKFSFSICNSNKQIITSFHSTKFTTFNDRGRGKSNLLNSFLIRKTDNITIVCETFKENAMLAETIPVTSSNKIQIPEAFKDYLDNAQFSDVKFFVEDRTIFAHQMVLAANSIFADLFDHEIQDKRDCTLFIENDKYEVFYELLRFMYTGETDLSEAMAISELLKASHKYKVLDLKRMCEIEISKNLSKDNVIECLNLADKYNAQILKKNAIDFIVSHGQEMIDQPEFDSLRNLHVELFKDIFRSFVAQPDKKRKIN